MIWKVQTRWWWGAGGRSEGHSLLSRGGRALSCKSSHIFIMSALNLDISIKIVMGLFSRAVCDFSNPREWAYFELVLTSVVLGVCLCLLCVLFFCLLSGPVVEESAGTWKSFKHPAVATKYICTTIRTPTPPPP